MRGVIPLCRPLLTSLSVVTYTRTGGRSPAPIGFSCVPPSSRSCRSRKRMTTTMYANPELIDVDCNLWHRDLKSLQGKDSDSDKLSWNILEEDAVEQANIVAMLSPSSTITEAKRGLDLLTTKAPPLPIKTTVGVHPYHVNDEEFTSMSIHDVQSAIKTLIEEYTIHCAAVGECGLDATEGFPPLEDQIPFFRAQVELANELNFPLFVHERLAFQTTMDILRDTTTPVIIHCFTGTKEECIEYIKRGYFISVSGYILKDTNDNCDEVISCLTEDVIPLDKLMIETDAPYMGFPGCRDLYIEHNEAFVEGLNSKKKKRLKQSVYPNVPSSLPNVLKKVAECYQRTNPDLSTDEIARMTAANAQHFFGL